jgi:DNA-binding Lrp family transcriptional regulator
VNSIEIDKTDRGIIEALVEDGRISFRALGERVGLADDAVRERYNRLQESGIVRIVGVPHPATLGYHSIAFVGVTVSGPVAPVERMLAVNPALNMVVVTFGAFDIAVEIAGADDGQLLDRIDKEIRSIPGVVRCTVYPFSHVSKWASSVLSGSSVIRPSLLTEVDDDDRRLIAALQANGRASFAELATAVGQNYAQARRRTKALLDAGVVQTVTSVNWPILGFSVMAAIAVRVRDRPLSEVASELGMISRVEIVICTFGPADLLLEVSCRDRAELDELINEKIRAISGVSSTETFLYVRIARLPVQWGADALSSTLEHHRR